MVNLDVIKREDNKVSALISSAQVLTASWADLGKIFNLMDVLSIGLWLDIDINDSLDLRVRFVGSKIDNPSASDLYNVPILEIQTGVVNIRPEYYEFSDDVDQKIIVSFSVSDHIIYGKFQVQVGTLGVTPAQILSAGIAFKSNPQGSGRGV